MDLSHYTAKDKPLIQVIDGYEYGEHKRERARFFKPCGLWLSVDGEQDWPAWCTDADFGSDRLHRRFRIKLTPSVSVLHLSSTEQILEFTEAYFTTPYWVSDCTDIDWKGHWIDWYKVAESYDGIIVAPYVYYSSLQTMMKMDWLSSWDCASGCIWRSRAIQSIEEDLNWTYCKP